MIFNNLKIFCKKFEKIFFKINFFLEKLEYSTWGINISSEKAIAEAIFTICWLMAKI